MCSWRFLTSLKKSASNEVNVWFCSVWLFVDKVGNVGISFTSSVLCFCIRWKSCRVHASPGQDGSLSGGHLQTGSHALLCQCEYSCQSDTTKCISLQLSLLEKRFILGTSSYVKVSASKFNLKYKTKSLHCAVKRYVLECLFTNANWFVKGTLIDLHSLILICSAFTFQVYFF